MAAADRAGTPVVYFSTMNRDQVGELIERGRGHRPGAAGGSDRGSGGDGGAGQPHHHRGGRGPVDRPEAPVHAGPRQPDQRGQLLPVHDRRSVLELVWGREWYIRIRPEPGRPGPTTGSRPCCLATPPLPAARVRTPVPGTRPRGAEVSASHRVLRVHGGRLVVDERRLELETGLDAAAAEGFELINSFAVDDNVYLVLRRHGRLRPGSRRRGPGDRRPGGSELGEGLDGHHPVPPGLLGPVERLVGPLDERRDVLDPVPAGEAGGQGDAEVGGGVPAALRGACRGGGGRRGCRSRAGPDRTPRRRSAPPGPDL